MKIIHFIKFKDSPLIWWMIIFGYNLRCRHCNMAFQGHPLHYYVLSKSWRNLKSRTIRWMNVHWQQNWKEKALVVGRRRSTYTHTQNTKVRKLVQKFFIRSRRRRRRIKLLSPRWLIYKTLREEELVNPVAGFMTCRQLIN